MTTISNAINAYSALSRAITGEADSLTKESKGDSGALSQSVAPGKDFASVLQSAAKDSVSTLRNAETLSAAGIAGKADIREVVQAVTNAELTLQTVVNVRDKVISAYNDIIHLPV